MEPLEVAALRLAAGMLHAERLPDLATDALVRGLDSPALRELAGTSPLDVRDGQDLFVLALDQLGIPVLDEQQALRQLVIYTAGRIVTGELMPYDGAHWIWVEAFTSDMQDDTASFAGLASEWEEHPSDRLEIEAEIVGAAQELLHRNVRPEPGAGSTQRT